MTSTAATVEAEIQAAVDSILCEKYNSFKTCEYCGIKCAGGAVYCECAALVRAYGSVSCSCCGIEYGVYDDILSYIDNLGGDRTAEDLAADLYMKKLLSAMPTPCSSCSYEYQETHAHLCSSYNSWRKVYDRRRYLEARYEEEELFGICTSGSGAPCHCCGD
jgi:hypothetical protein